MHADREYQKPAFTNKKPDKHDGDDSESDSSPRFPRKKRKPNPRNGKKRRSLAIVSPRVNMCSARRQGNPSAGTSFTPVSSKMNLTLPRPISNWMNFWLGVMLP